MVCFDIDYLRKPLEHKANRLKIQQTASTVVSPKYHNPKKKVLSVQKRYNRSVPDSIVCGNQKINEIVNYVGDLKEKLKSVRKENRMIEGMLKVQEQVKVKVKEREGVWKSVEKFKRKLKVKLK